MKKIELSIKELEMLEKLLLENETKENKETRKKISKILDKTLL